MNVTLKVLTLFAMLFCHIVDDYYLQGILASMKQKEWWQKNAPNELYRNDYKIALIEHGFSWAFMTLLPLVIVGIHTGNNDIIAYVLAVLPANAAIHAYVDNYKANKHEINLIQDQVCHFVQIAFTWLLSLKMMIQ